MGKIARINFSNSEEAADVNGFWSNLSSNAASATADILEFVGGADTGWDITLGVNGAGAGSGGVNAVGTGDADWVDEAIISLSNHLVTSGGTTETDYTLSGLNDANKYTIKIFSSRDSGGPREADFSIDGFSNFVTLDSGLNSTNIVTIAEITPSSGIITLDMRLNAGSSFGYLNAIEIEETVVIQVGGWNKSVKTQILPTDFTRISDTVLELTLGPIAEYDITINENVESLVVADVLATGSPAVATPTFQIMEVGGGGSTTLIIGEEQMSVLNIDGTSQYVTLSITDENANPKTGLTWDTAGLAISYLLEGAASVVDITLATMTLGSWVSGGFVEIDATKQKGKYRLGVPDALCVATTNVFSASIVVEAIAASIRQANHDVGLVTLANISDSGLVESNVKQMNDVVLIGSGVDGDEWEGTA